MVVDLLSKDKHVRQRIESIFNKDEDQFDSKLEYDDYLEQKEDIIFNLVEGIDVEETERRVKEYEKENAEGIAENEARKAEQLMAKQAAADRAQELPAANVQEEQEDGLGTGELLQQQQQQIHTIAPLPLPEVELVGEKEMRSLLGKQSRQEWRNMAMASGWTEQYQKEKCCQIAFKSLYIF